MFRKHCGQRRNCSLQAISPVTTVFSTDVLQIHKTQGLFGKELIMCKYFIYYIVISFPKDNMLLDIFNNLINLLTVQADAE